MSAEPIWTAVEQAHFKLGFIGADGRYRCGSLSQCWGEPFEHLFPVREFVSYRGQKNFTGFSGGSWGCCGLWL
jgi:hypothetical protein